MLVPGPSSHLAPPLPCSSQGSNGLLTAKQRDIPVLTLETLSLHPGSVHTPLSPKKVWTPKSLKVYIVLVSLMVYEGLEVSTIESIMLFTI